MHTSKVKATKCSSRRVNNVFFFLRTLFSIYVLFKIIICSIIIFVVITIIYGDGSKHPSPRYMTNAATRNLTLLVNLSSKLIYYANSLSAGLILSKNSCYYIVRFYIQCFVVLSSPSSLFVSKQYKVCYIIHVVRYIKRQVRYAGKVQCCVVLCSTIV